MPALELDALEARILGVLIEKEFTTPDQYPLSLNSLTLGCNQKSNRDPVLDLNDSEVRAGIERLRPKGLVGAAHGAGARVEKYRHQANAVWGLAPVELAVVAELLLRGAQMPGELRGRADRMAKVETLEVLGTVLENLRQKGFVRRLEPLPGARAPQWEQIVAAATGAAGTPTPRTALEDGAFPVPRPLAASQTPSTGPTVPTPAASPARPLEQRVATLEAEVAELRRLYGELTGKSAP